MRLTIQSHVTLISRLSYHLLVNSTLTIRYCVVGGGKALTVYRRNLGEKTLTDKVVLDQLR